jgi:hypothetical protein
MALGAHLLQKIVISGVILFALSLICSYLLSSEVDDVSGFHDVRCYLPRGAHRERNETNPMIETQEGRQTKSALDIRSAHPVSSRKATPMTISQQTTSLLDTMREAGPDEYMEAVLTVRDTSQSLQSAATTGRNGIKDDMTEMMLPYQRTHHQFAYPAWPTSTPGPQETLPLPGQKPHPTRTDQMIYEYYDQERGMSCVPPPMQVVQKIRARKNLPGARLQKVAFEEL